MTTVQGSPGTDGRAAYFPRGVRLVLLYDAHCGLCRASMRWLQQRDSAGRLAPVPLQDARALDLFGLSVQEAEGEMHAFSREGEHRRGADAVLWAVAMLPRYGWLRLLMPLPGFMPAARAVYRGVAGRRRRDLCQGDTCRLH